MKTLILALMLSIAGISSSVVLAQTATAGNDTTYTSPGPAGPGMDDEDLTVLRKQLRR